MMFTVVRRASSGLFDHMMRAFRDAHESFCETKRRSQF